MLLFNFMCSITVMDSVFINVLMKRSRAKYLGHVYSMSN